MSYPVLSSELEAICLQSARYKFCNLTSFMRPRRKVENVNNISLNFMMFKVQQPNFQELLCYHLFHLTKVSSHINYWIIFDTIYSLEKVMVNYYYNENSACGKRFNMIQAMTRRFRNTIIAESTYEKWGYFIQIYGICSVSKCICQIIIRFCENNVLGQIYGHM